MCQALSESAIQMRGARTFGMFSVKDLGAEGGGECRLLPENAAHQGCKDVCVCVHTQAVPNFT